jgi:hypothetical protein
MKSHFKQKPTMADFPTLTKNKIKKTNENKQDYKNKLLIPNIQPVEIDDVIVVNNIEVPVENELTDDAINWFLRFDMLATHNEIQRLGEDVYYTLYPPYINMFDHPKYNIDDNDEDEDELEDEINSDYDFD